jgi:hypothetical protein
MEIKYLKNLEDFYSNNIKISRIGVAESEIEKLETDLGVKLPQAYREFLFLAGRRDNIIGDWNSEFDDLEFIQEYAADAFKGVGLQMRPFWCFAEYCDADSSLFFFLDEGDDPPVYNFAAEKIIKDESGNRVFFKKTDNSFSICINDFIKEALK